MKILIADDDLAILRVLERFVASLGHEVHVACDGQEALEILEKDPAVGLLLSDYNMPRMHGVELCRRARSMPRPGRLRIVIMSGTVDVTHEFRAAGADAFIPKPFSPLVVADEIRLAEELVVRIRPVAEAS